MAGYVTAGYVTAGYVTSSVLTAFTVIPSYSSSVDFTPKILEASFGDGYSQAVGNGVNYNPQKWNLVFSNISPSTATTIINFFKTNNTATTPFDWTDPEGVAGRYKCKSWKRIYDTAGTANLTCMFEEVYF